MKAPVHMYYMLENYYQNHRRYVKSRSDKQLRGETGLTPSLLSDCSPRAFANPNGPDDVANAINPCGLIAWSLFNDTFSLHEPGGKRVSLNKAGIAWESDVSTKYKNSAETGSNFPPFAGKDCSPGSGQCTEDEDFIVWMRTAGLPTFRKLYRTITTDLEPGDYTVVVQNGELLSKRGSVPVNRWTNRSQTLLYPVHPFGGHKYVVLTTTIWIGGRNDFLGYAYIIVGMSLRCPAAARTRLRWQALPVACVAAGTVRERCPGPAHLRAHVLTRHVPPPPPPDRNLPLSRPSHADRRTQPGACGRLLRKAQALATQARRHILSGLV